MDGFSGRSLQTSIDSPSPVILLGADSNHTFMNIPALSWWSREALRRLFPRRHSTVRRGLSSFAGTTTIMPIILDREERPFW